VTAAGNVAVRGSETILLGRVGGSPSSPACADFAPDADCIASDSITHTVGGIRFGSDRKLYVATGDGADFVGIDLNAFRAQDLDNLSGKILRIESDGRAASGNPFDTGNPNDIRSKVWAYGFRNPYRFSFHPDSPVVIMAGRVARENHRLAAAIRILISAMVSIPIPIRSTTTFTLKGKVRSPAVLLP